MNVKRVIADFWGEDCFAYDIDGTIYFIWHHEDDLAYIYEGEQSSDLISTPSILEEIDSGEINIRHVKYVKPTSLKVYDERPSKDKRFDVAITMEGLIRRLCSEEERGI